MRVSREVEHRNTGNTSLFCIQPQFASKKFSLIYMVPDFLSRLFGAGTEQLGHCNDTRPANQTIVAGFSTIGAAQSGLPCDLR